MSSISAIFKHVIVQNLESCCMSHLR